MSLNSFLSKGQNFNFNKPENWKAFHIEIAKKKDFVVTHQFTTFQKVCFIKSRINQCFVVVHLPEYSQSSHKRRGFDKKCVPFLILRSCWKTPWFDEFFRNFQEFFWGGGREKALGLSLIKVIRIPSTGARIEIGFIVFNFITKLTFFFHIQLKFVLKFDLKFTGLVILFLKTIFWRFWLGWKGQIISECPSEIIVFPIRPTKKFPRFLS